MFFKNQVKVEKYLKSEIESSIVNIYLNSYNDEQNKKQFRNELYNGFTEEEINFDINDEDEKEKYKILFKILFEIQKISNENIEEPHFNISSFINNECNIIQIQYINMIKTFIIKTNKDLDNRKNDISN